MDSYNQTLHKNLWSPNHKIDIMSLAIEAKLSSCLQHITQQNALERSVKLLIRLSKRKRSPHFIERKSRKVQKVNLTSFYFKTFCNYLDA